MKTVDLGCDVVWSGAPCLFMKVRATSSKMEGNDGSFTFSYLRHPTLKLNEEANEHKSMSGFRIL